MNWTVFKTTLENLFDWDLDRLNLISQYTSLMIMLINMNKGELVGC